MGGLRDHQTVITIAARNQDGCSISVGDNPSWHVVMNSAGRPI